MLVGVLSDTHLVRPDDRFRLHCLRCFGDCSVIIHPGDLTEVAVLDVFAGKPVFAVHGNMCSTEVKRELPQYQCFRLGRFRIGLVHGAGLGPDREGELILRFPEADCIVSGHTHRPLCRRYGRTLFVNPGSFRSTGLYGAPGTYALLELDKTLRASIHEVPGELE